LLALSLSQHPNLRQVGDNAWLEPFMLGLQRSFGEAAAAPQVSQLEALGIEVEDLFAHFGRCVNRLMLASVGAAPAPGGRPGRWVDSTPSHVATHFGLLRLFPAAKVVHMVRDVDEVVAALTEPERRDRYRSRWIEMTPEEAYRHWLEAARAGEEAEQAFGSATVMRVRRRDLVEAPEATVRRCLDFVAEPFAAACLRPFR
jgi:hypothetical protein